MSILATQAKESIYSLQYFSDDYRRIIAERDKSFYNKNYSEYDNFSYVINRYSGNEYSILNNYLRDGTFTPNHEFTKNDLRSWAYCLHSSLQFRTSNVSNGTKVYRGISRPAPSSWKVGRRFYFGEFVSTSLEKQVGINFSQGQTLLVITIKNNGTNGRNNYCRWIGDIGEYGYEDEVLITAFCIYEITDIEEDEDGCDNIIYMDCLGY